MATFIGNEILRDKPVLLSTLQTDRSLKAEKIKYLYALRYYSQIYEFSDKCQELHSSAFIKDDIKKADEIYQDLIRGFFFGQDSGVNVIKINYLKEGSLKSALTGDSLHNKKIQ